MSITMLLICHQVSPCIIKLCNVHEIRRFITKPKNVTRNPSCDVSIANSSLWNPHTYVVVVTYLFSATTRKPAFWDTPPPPPPPHPHPPPPTPPPILVIHIRSLPSQRKTKSKLHIFYKYEMDPTRNVGVTERTRDAGRTDGLTDRRMEWNQYTPPPPPPPTFVVYNDVKVAFLGFPSITNGIKL